jgi:hypothetical protein
MRTLIYESRATSNNRVGLAETAKKRRAMDAVFLPSSETTPTSQRRTPTATASTEASQQVNLSRLSVSACLLGGVLTSARS